MWKAFWRKWTIDRPAAFGDLLWDVLVVQLAALLDRVTFRDIIAFIPVVILVWAYAHHIPLPPELMLVGDLLAYIDIFSVVFLLGVLSRIATVLFIVKQASAHVTGLPSSLLKRIQDVRHRREARTRNRKRLTGSARDDDGEMCRLRLGLASRVGRVRGVTDRLRIVRMDVAHQLSALTVHT